MVNARFSSSRREYIIIECTRYEDLRARSIEKDVVEIRSISPLNLETIETM